MPHSDANSTNMRIICEDQLATRMPTFALSRSARLADVHLVDPNGCVHMPCDARTWTAWLTNDPSRITAENMDLMLDVIKVRSSYTLHHCMSSGAATGSITLKPRL
jgi:hypothetical protein